MLSEIQHQPEAVKYLRKVADGTLRSPLLLLGQEGTGRRFSVLRAIQESLCEGTKQPGCQCAPCYQVLRGIHPDVHVLVGEKDEIGIDEIRELITSSKQYPSASDSKFFIIDGADRITVPAANAFLKTLEEPPAKSRFFLLAESKQYVLPTIRSRCGAVRYQNLPDAFVLSVLLRFSKDQDKALVYAKLGEGSVGRALGYMSAGRLTLRDHMVSLLQVAQARDLPRLFSIVETIEKELDLGMRFLDQLLHDVFIVRVDPSKAINTDIVPVIQELSMRESLGSWQRLTKNLGALQSQYRKVSLNLPFQIKTLLVTNFTG